jgi:cyclic pyranopterin phosphate synthase
MSHDDILRYEEIEKIVRASAEMGVKSVRVTGGEPLVRPELPKLVSMLSEVKGIDEVTLTTNGMLLADCAQELKKAGLKRVNISLDTLREDRFEEITGARKLEEVSKGIEAARKAGLNPVKMNTVVLGGVNDDEVLDFSRKTKEEGWHIRFIEYMPLMGKQSEQVGLVAIKDMEAMIEDAFGELKPCGVISGSGPARYYSLQGAEGTIGFISPVSECFCQDCNRFRLTADGRLKPCLLSNEEFNIKTLMRNGARQEDVKKIIEEAVARKPRNHNLKSGINGNKRQMWQIGG